MSKIVDSIIGHAIGDAMGVPTEFCLREKLLENPITKMVGCMKTGQPAGTWSDDTSMEIATIDSFIENNSFVYSDIMDKWNLWLKGEKYTGAGECFDVGRTCLRAVMNYQRGADPIEAGLKDINSNGNGSLMRILPVALYSYAKKLNEQEIIKLTNDISSLTHRHDISKLGCYMYVRYIIYLLEGYDKFETYKLIQNLDYSSYSEEANCKYNRILNSDISLLELDEISSTGYVVDTLESAIWILLKTNNFNEAIITSTNIGNDTDTIGAILGSMAGIIYGLDNVKKQWIDTLQRREYLYDLAEKFESKISN